MAKNLASNWIAENALPEYRMTVYYPSDPSIPNKITRLLKSFRDGKVRISGVDPILDMGMSTHYDYLEVWSKNREGMEKLRDWFHRMGCETAGVW